MLSKWGGGAKKKKPAKLRRFGGGRPEFPKPEKLGGVNEKKLLYRGREAQTLKGEKISVCFSSIVRHHENRGTRGHGSTELNQGAKQGEDSINFKFKKRIRVEGEFNHHSLRRSPRGEMSRCSERRDGKQESNRPSEKRERDGVKKSKLMQHHKKMKIYQKTRECEENIVQTERRQWDRSS